MLKKTLVYICIFSTFSVITNIAKAEEIDLGGVKKQTVNLKPSEKVMKGSLIVDNKEALDNLVQIQHNDEIKDLELLWKSTVDRNDLIKFTMKKLNTPESHRRLHSSAMAKTVSALVYGASFLPTFAGADSLVQSASFTTGRLANSYINKADGKQNPPLSDTELIELAGMIETLQDSIISSYYNYKGSLNKLKDTRSRILLYNKNYSEALRSKGNIEQIISSALYDDMLIQEYNQEQNAKKYYLELERLAGKETVDKLLLSQYAFKNQLLNTEAIKKN